MGFLDLAAGRRSVRRYEDRRVEPEKMERCIEAARLAPSACNGQPWHFIIVDDPQLREAIARQTFGPLVRFNRFALTAPVLVVLVVEPSNATSRIGGMVTGRQYRMIDIGIAAQHFCLQAAEEGLGTCMLGWFNERPILRLIGAPRGRRIGLVLTVGYAAGDTPAADGTTESGPAAAPKRRKSIGEISSRNRY